MGDHFLVITHFHFCGNQSRCNSLLMIDLGLYIGKLRLKLPPQSQHGLVVG
jgi:hypothetical protein